MACQGLGITTVPALTNGTNPNVAFMNYDGYSCNVTTYEPVHSCSSRRSYNTGLCCRLYDMTYIDVPQLKFNSTPYPYAYCYLVAEEKDNSTISNNTINNTNTTISNNTSNINKSVASYSLLILLVSIISSM